MQHSNRIGELRRAHGPRDLDWTKVRIGCLSHLLVVNRLTKSVFENKLQTMDRVRQLLQEAFVVLVTSGILPELE